MNRYERNQNRQLFSGTSSGRYAPRSGRDYRSYVSGSTAHTLPPPPPPQVIDWGRRVRKFQPGDSFALEFRGQAWTLEVKTAEYNFGEWCYRFVLGGRWEQGKEELLTLLIQRFTPTITTLVA